MLPLLNINSASVIGWLESAAAQQWIVGILLVLLFISFIKEWMPVEITALTGTAVLMLTGILSTRDVLSSFANSGPLTVVCMFILSASLERTGLIGDLSKLFNKVAKGRELTALLVITLGAFMVSPFVNNTPVVVILMPIVLAFCRDHNIAASKLLIPLSYAKQSQRHFCTGCLRVQANRLLHANKLSYFLFQFLSTWTSCNPTAHNSITYLTSLSLRHIRWRERHISSFQICTHNI